MREGLARLMTYRKKLFILLGSLVMVSNGIVALASFDHCKHLLRAEIHRKARAVASTIAALLDPKDVAVIDSRGAELKPQYEKLLATLRTVRDANRRDDVWIDRIFTLIGAPENPRFVEDGVDTEEHFEYAKHPGDVYLRDGKPVSIGIDGIDRLANNLTNFQAGHNNAFAPVRDSNGRVVAEVGVTLLPVPFDVLKQLVPEIFLPFAVTVILAIALALFLSRQVTRPLYSLRASIDAIGKGDLTAVATANSTVEFTEMAAAINTMAAGLRERETVKRVFSGYMSRQMLELITSKGELPALKGERRRITVLFSDIRGFTAMAERMRPEEVVELLSEFFSLMVDVILRYQGTIDKFLGDGMMVIFGAPIDDPDQEEHAVLAALEMQRELTELTATWAAQGRRTFKIGIGINSGSAVVGNIGSQEHMEYTAIGDTVNLAARLETATKELCADIVVSEQTYDAVRHLFIWRAMGDLVVKGRAEPVRSYAVEGLKESNSVPPSST
jgi:adenylate cyclase